MLNKIVLRGIQSLKISNSLTYNFNKFSVRAFSRTINKSKNTS